jgi:hypothetical protein
MLILVLSLASVSVEGCANKNIDAKTALAATDFIYIPKGTPITGVKLPTDENKTYTIITPKDGWWISKDGDERLNG